MSSSVTPPSVTPSSVATLCDLLINDVRGEEFADVPAGAVQPRAHRCCRNSQHLDASLAALADSTRRGVLEQLGCQDASITALADRFHMTLTGMKKHVSVLEQAGLVVTEKVGRVRTCRIGARRLEEAAAWIERYHQLWDTRFGELDQVIEELKQKEKSDGRKQAR